MARHCDKWMRLSEPKLRDRVDQWIAEHDPTPCRYRPKVEDGHGNIGDRPHRTRHGRDPGPAGCLDAAAFEQRLITIAAPSAIRIPPGCSAAPTPSALGPWPPLAGLPVRADCPAVAGSLRRRVVIHVL